MITSPRAERILGLLKRLPGLAGMGMGLLALAGWALSPQGGTRHFFLTPLEAACFLLLGVSVWLQAGGRPGTLPRRVAVAAAAVAGLTGLAMFLHGISQGGSLSAQISFYPGLLASTAILFAPGLSFAVMGLSILFLDRGSPRVRNLTQVFLIPVFWVAYLTLVARFYGVTQVETFYILPIPLALLMLTLGAGILSARPRQGLVQVLLSPFTGGLLARMLLPIITILPFTAGWLRLRTLRSGGYDLGSSFAMFTSTNALAFGIFIWFSARTLNRIDSKRKQAYDSLRAGNLELRRLNEALQGEMAEHKDTEQARRQMERQLFQSQKMEAIGTLASGIAHDFNNILTVILLNAETAQETAAPGDPVQQNLQEIRKSSSRASDLIRQIMTFGRKNEGHPESVRLEDVVAEAVEMLRHTLPPNIRIETVLQPDTPPVMADSTQVQQVILNLGTNAAHAMAEKGGLLEIRTSPAVITPEHARYSAELREGTYARLTVSDTGHGMDDATLKQIFDPFFTTKPPGKGTGLGLSVVHGILRLHQGSVTAYSQPGKGSLFNLYFPIVTDATVPGSISAPAKPPAGSGEHILCLDDNVAILLAITRSLEGLGYRVTGHTEPAAALADFRSRPGEFDLVLTDFSMPGSSGAELARALLIEDPDLPVILMSGYLRPEDAREAHEAGIRHVMLKPDLPGELGRVLHRLLAERKEARNKISENTGKSGSGEAG